jgi:hypothetical protein
MSTAATVLSDRARHIARGLIRTKRASRGTLPSADAEFAQLPTIPSGGFYWITVDGSRLMRGATFVGAVELQPGFAEQMARAGA